MGTWTMDPYHDAWEGYMEMERVRLAECASGKMRRAVGRPPMDERGPPRALNKQAWDRFMVAERKHLSMRTEGHLARLLGSALPDEEPEGLLRFAEEDQLRAEEVLVDLMDELGEITHKHIDEITPQDRSAMLRAEGARLEWIVGRRYSRKG